MIGSIKSWITSIVAIMIFSTLADIILPKGNLKKLSKLVIGFIVIIVVLNPILSLMNKQESVSGSINNYMNTLTINEKNGTSVSNTYNSETLSLFKENLKKSIEQEIVNDTKKNYTVVGLGIDEQQNSKDFLSVKSLVLTPKANKLNIKKIKKVSIGKKVESYEVFYDREVSRLLNQKFNITDGAIKFVR